MADGFKILAQSFPVIATLTDAYTVPALTSTVVSSVAVCNKSTTPSTFRISLAVAGAADTDKQYLYFDVPILGNDTFIATIGVTLAVTDVVRVYSGNGLMAFNVFGVEIT
jgi:hypothetical protein